MRYISEDGKVFNTEQECLEHENSEKKRIDAERIKKEQFEAERKKLLKEISDEYNVLHEKIREYETKCRTKQRVSFAPLYEIIDMLCGI